MASFFITGGLAMSYEMLSAKSWQHGGLTPSGEVPDASVLDLSVNINPYGPDPELCNYLRFQPFDQYPDPQQTAVRQGLARLHQTDPAGILIGNGANELFWAAARAFLKPDDRWLSIEPNYSEFARAAAATRARQIDLRALPEKNFQWQIQELEQLIDQHQPRWIMSSNPCSPTGFFQDPDLWLQLAVAYPDILFGLDHSFLSLSRHWQSGDRQWPVNVIRFQSLTKDFAIAGLRLGYALGHPSWIQAMQEQLPTWSVNSLAQAAGLWITRHHDSLNSSRQQVLQDHTAMELELRSRKIHYIPSSTVYSLFQPRDAEALRQRLWDRQRILVRSAASYGLPDWLRIAARPPSVMQYFWQALDEEFLCKH
jgi:histidinol-phosphate/aromatic aminotransferase/cobyric acid decarboxylase-like protein